MEVNREFINDYFILALGALSNVLLAVRVPLYCSERHIQRFSVS